MDAEIWMASTEGKDQTSRSEQYRSEVWERLEGRRGCVLTQDVENMARWWIW